MKFPNDDERIDPITGAWKDGGWLNFPCERARPRFAELDVAVDWEKLLLLRHRSAETVDGDVTPPKPKVVTMLKVPEVMPRRMEAMENPTRRPAAGALSNFNAKVEDAFAMAERARSTEVKQAVVQHEIQIAVEELRAELDDLLRRKQTA